MNPFLALIAHLQNALQTQAPGLGLGGIPQQLGLPGPAQVAPGLTGGLDTSVSPRPPVAAPITPPTLAQSPSRPSNPFAGLGGGTGAGGCVC